MKVKFIKEHELGSNTFKVGKSYEVINSLAESWIEQGICEEDNSVPLPQVDEEETTEEEVVEVAEATEAEPEPEEAKPQRRRRRNSK